MSGEPVQAGSLDELIGHCIIWRIAVARAMHRANDEKLLLVQTVGWPKPPR
ncbi:MAG: hypothetical protein ING52_15230 [Burkholderiales bacterium]|nr:hypothetical protein [Rhodocyclaceae bacterium]MCA3226831.1 hypothetical protein [Burkholderiales bacterium]MCA3076110.1 hypothetical protein [Rhodocyclaceae bacterium]MCA3089986.1 hypothetical protein [Rhodocyclaceae bacterium]MCA3093634.1 hypothetical protein [Rhodocyclaceae bacterium]